MEDQHTHPETEGDVDEGVQGSAEDDGEAVVKDLVEEDGDGLGTGTTRAKF